MRLSELLTPSRIRIPLHAHDKEGVLRELVELIIPEASAGGGGAGTTLDPIAYETIDGQPVRIFFLLAGPESQSGAHVKAISRISRLVRREPVRAQLLGARTAEEFYRVLCEADT